MAEQDYGHCDECGKPLTAEDAYDAAFEHAADTLMDVTEPLAGEDVVGVCLGPIACYLSGVTEPGSDERQALRAYIIHQFDQQVVEIDELTQDRRGIGKHDA